MIFEVKCDTTNEGRTHGPDGAMFVPFIVLDVYFQEACSLILSSRSQSDGMSIFSNSPCHCLNSPIPINAS